MELKHFQQTETCVVLDGNIKNKMSPFSDDLLLTTNFTFPSNSCDSSNKIRDIVLISREALVLCSFVNAAGFVSGTICNTLVMVTIAMTRKLLNTSINRAVLNLCLADLFVILIDVPLTTAILIGNHINYMVSTNRVQLRPLKLRNLQKYMCVRRYIYYEFVKLCSETTIPHWKI